MRIYWQKAKKNPETFVSGEIHQSGEGDIIYYALKNDALPQKISNNPIL